MSATPCSLSLLRSALALLTLGLPLLPLSGCKEKEDPRLLGTAGSYVGAGSSLAYEVKRPDGWPGWISPPQDSVCRAGEGFVQNGRDLVFICYLITAHEEVVEYYKELLANAGYPYGLDPPAPHPKGVRPRRTSLSVQNLEAKKKHSLIVNIQELDEAKAAEIGAEYVENLQRIEMHFIYLGF